MALSAISSTSLLSASQLAQTVSHRKHGSHHGVSLSDVDAAGSSVASAPSATGKVGSKLNITA